MAHEPYNLLARYQLIERALTDRRLARGDCVVLSVILSHVDEDGEAWPRLSRIAEKSGISKRTAIRAIDNLECLGYLEVERTFGTSSLYRIKPDGVTKPVTSVSPVDGFDMDF